MKKSTIIIIIVVVALVFLSRAIPDLVEYVKEKERKEEIQKQEEAERQKKLENGEFFTVNGVTFYMVKVKGGTFTMGEQNFPDHWAMWSDGYDEGLDIYYSQQVTLDDFSIGECEVTCELWKAVMGDFPIKEITVGSRSQIDSRNQEIAETFPFRCPITKFNYIEFQEFIKRLNKITGKNFRLPTEAEWEYAARGGCLSKGYAFSGSNVIDEVAQFHGDKPQAVMSLKPNELGIYDMSGNVSEMCQDRFNWKRNLSERKVVKLSPVTNPLCTEQAYLGKRGYGDNDNYNKKSLFGVMKGGSISTNTSILGYGDLYPNWRGKYTITEDNHIYGGNFYGFRLALSK